MQAVKGYLREGYFTPHESIALPKWAEVTLLFGKAEKHDDEKEFWAGFDRAMDESASENELLKDEAFSRRTTGRDHIDYMKRSQKEWHSH